MIAFACATKHTWCVFPRVPAVAWCSEAFRLDTSGACKLYQAGPLVCFQLCACVVFCWPIRWICMWGHITQTCTRTKTFLWGGEWTKVRWVGARAVGELAAVCVKRKRETSCTKTTRKAGFCRCSLFFTISPKLLIRFQIFLKCKHEERMLLPAVKSHCFELYKMWVMI